MYILCTTCLHILLAHSCLYYYLLSLQYTVLHILFYFTFYSFYSYFVFFTSFFSYLYLCIFSCVCVIYNYTVHGADLTYISLLVIFCIIVYVMNTILKWIEFVAIANNTLQGSKWSIFLLYQELLGYKVKIFSKYKYICDIFVICIAKDFIWTTLKVIFFFCTLRFQILK